MASTRPRSQSAPPGVSDEAPRRLMRFCLWNDLHVMAPDIPGRPPAPPQRNERAVWARQQLDMPSAAPDFVLSAGDLVHGERRNMDRDFAMLRTLLLDDLPVPLLPCVGNHENQQGEGDPALNAAYDRCFGPEWHNYVFTVAGFGFIVIDNSGGHRTGDDVTTARLETMQRAFAFLGGMPTIIVAHIPLVPMRDSNVLAESFGFASWIDRDPRMLPLIEAHRDHVIAVLSGHLHLTAVCERRGIHHIVPAGTTGYPADYATFDVYPDRIDLAMHAAPEHLLPPGHATNRKGNIHGKPRHEADYVDADHPEPWTYVHGTPTERARMIPLPPAKRPDAARAREPLTVWHETDVDQWQQVALPQWASR